MARALLLPFVILGLVATGSVAHAKPKVAVLGLEALQGKAAIDTQTTVVAHDITEALRSRAKSGTGTLTLAPGAEKELLDEKITHSCDDEGVDCMNAIGKALGADFLMYGNIEKIDDKDPTKRGYRVNLKMLNIGKKGAAQNVSDFIPLANANDDNLKTWSKRSYSKLTGQDTTGTLIVRANVDRGTVLVDGVPKATLTSGMATIPLEEGRYAKLAIEAEGYKLWEAEEPITIRTGDSVTRQAELEKKKTVNDELGHDVGGTVSHPASHGVAKGAMYVSFAIAGLAGVAWIYDSQVNLKAYENQSQGAFIGPPDPANKAIQGQGHCGDDVYGPGSGDYKKSCRAHTRTIAEVATTAVAGAVGLGLLAYIATRHDTVVERPASRAKPRKTIAIVPVWTPESSGAVMTLTW